jgi:hypothetical protein
MFRNLQGHRQEGTEKRHTTAANSVKDVRVQSENTILLIKDY